MMHIISSNQRLKNGQKNVIKMGLIAEKITTFIKKLFEIDEAKEVRLWNKYMSSTFELLNKSDVSLQDAGLYAGQVRIFLFSHTVKPTLLTTVEATLLAQTLYKCTNS